jgi:hypothetical protein
MVMDWDMYIKHRLAAMRVHADIRRKVDVEAGGINRETTPRMKVAHWTTTSHVDVESPIGGDTT